MDFNTYLQTYLASNQGALQSAQKQSETALQQALNNQKNTLGQTLANQSSSAREQTEAIKQNLLNALTKNQTNIADNKVQTRNQYRENINKTNVDHTLQQKRLQEAMAQQGITGGDSAQSMLMGNIGRQGAIGGLVRQENSVYDQLARMLEQYQTDYSNSTASADNELSRLLRDYQNNYNTQLGAAQSNYELEQFNVANQYAQKMAELQAQAAQMQYEYQLQQQKARSSGGSGGSGSTPAPTKSSAASSAKADMFNLIWSDPQQAYKQLTNGATANQLKYLGVYDDLMAEYKAAATELRRTTPRKTTTPTATKKTTTNVLSKATRAPGTRGYTL